MSGSPAVTEPRRARLPDTDFVAVVGRVPELRGGRVIAVVPDVAPPVVAPFGHDAAADLEQQDGMSPRDLLGSPGRPPRVGRPLTSKSLFAVRSPASSKITQASSTREVSVDGLPEDATVLPLEVVGALVHHVEELT